MSKLSFENGGIAKLGFVVGKNKINTDDVLRTIYKEFGEHWNESAKKFEILEKELVNPDDVGVFSINKGFSLEENDTLLFMNFETVNMDKFLADITRMPLKLYSLYNLKDRIINLFTKENEATSSISSVIETHSIKLLVLTEQSRINDINFYMNGMENKLSPNITYAINNLGLFQTKESVINLIDNNPFDGVILDFNIGMYNRIEDIKSTLSKIDAIIKPISEASKEKGYTFIISSLYGMYASVTEGVVPKVIDFALKVPVIFQSNDFTKAEYTIGSGDTYDLGLTYLTNINDEVKSNRIVKKLSGLDKMLSKKK